MIRIPALPFHLKAKRNIIAKVERIIDEVRNTPIGRRVNSGPLSPLEWDHVVAALREQWLPTKERTAFLRQAELTQIASIRELAKRAKNAKDINADELICVMTGRKPDRKGVLALKQFEKREFKARRRRGQVQTI